ncbi:Ribosomal large subunit pseudouridine synthase D [Anaerohalosphaera lusitana]|uniref:Pseudouridine synthase n=1 Tax=Anaerohalosphaera lusitana TaxID=1936003 RepID=A0A1U9NGW2_9BACT|nr:RluA family pseudouridine synthase [Anaerohalosphaera lusitana]AQT67172.1 Ribosomal large subunit pseudouridine synthase D [Anaerohalosphaera lusitana]
MSSKKREEKLRANDQAGQDGNGGDDEDGEDEDELAGEELRFKVGTNLKYRRLDKYLGGRFSQFSRTKLQKLIKEQGVNVNGRPAKPSYKLNPKDEIDLILPPKEVRELIPEDIPINVIYEDDEMIVVNKQAGLIVHPARGYKSGTLVNGLVYYFQNQLSSVDEDYRPGIVHRLDRNTTGVMVVAKNDTAHWKLSRQFQERTTKKFYITVVHGSPELDADMINAPIGVHPHVREKMAVRPGGKEAISFYEVLERFRGYSLLKMGLKTGRTHQLRVHLAYLKHPIVADDMYGGKVVYPWQLEDREAAPEEPVMGRVALHAWKLFIKHPVSDEEMEFTADPPEDMQRFLDELRKYRAE